MFRRVISKYFWVKKAFRVKNIFQSFVKSFVENIFKRIKNVTMIICFIASLSHIFSLQLKYKHLS